MFWKVFWKASGDVINRNSSGFSVMPRTECENKAGRCPPADFSARLFYSALLLILFLGCRCLYTSPEKRKRKGNIRRENKNQECGPSEREKGEEAGINGAVNLAGRPIISLLPTFLDARHFFGYEPRVRLKTCYTHARYRPRKRRKRETER